MRHTRRAAAVCAAALTLSLTLTGCNLIKGLLPFGKEQPTTAPEVTTQAATAPSTAAPTTFAPTTAEPTTVPAPTEQPTQLSAKATPEKAIGSARLVETPSYTDDVLGVTFSMPEWQNKVYAKTEYNDGSYSLSFFEGSNLSAGLEKGYDGMGFLFSIFTSDAEAEGSVVYPAGTVTMGGETVYLCYFKPTDVRFDIENELLTENYRELYQYQREYFESGVFRSSMDYQPSSATGAINLTSN